MSDFGLLKTKDQVGGEVVVPSLRHLL
jgi:hypothetical protein